jgi:hypothetical protein
MKQHLSDMSRACFIAAVLFALAAYAVFGFQHGFEEQVGWYLILLPGSIVAAGLSDIIQKVIPGSKSAMFWGLLVGFNFFWYLGICFAFIKAYRFVANTSKRPF